MRIIGLVGPKSSGKDTSYEILRDLKKVDGKISFAGPLKQICSEVFGLHINMLNDPDLKELPLKEPITLTKKHIRAIIARCEAYVPSIQKDIIIYRANAVSVVGLESRVFKTPRELMQVIGTDLIRNRVYKNWHLEAAFSEKALAKLKKSGVFAVTDIRFANEHAFLADKFKGSYKAFYVDRPEASAALDESIASGTAHASESETQTIRAALGDSVILNDGSLDDLKDLLSKLDLGSPEVETPPVKGSRFRFVEK